MILMMMIIMMMMVLPQASLAEKEGCRSDYYQAKERKQFHQAVTNQSQLRVGEDTVLDRCR